MNDNSTNPVTIRAEVDNWLLRKADRLFPGTVDGRMIELLQNARRAGARHVHVTVQDGWVGVQDDGRGVEDFHKLLRLGASGWSQAIQAGEDPAGVGLFSWRADETILSRGRQIRLKGDGWTGAAVPVVDAPEHVAGTLVRFRADEAECRMWAQRDVLLPYAAFTGMTVHAADGTIEPASFLVPDARTYSHPELGVVVQILTGGAWPELHATVYNRLRSYSGENVLLNFHGQALVLRFDGVKLGRDVSPHYLIEMTGAPTELRLMLPARTRMVENPAFAELRRLLTLDTFRHLQARGRHTLPFKEWQRARDEFGVELPESEPVFEVGLLHNDHSAPEPPEISTPDNLTLAQCCRAGDELPEGATTNAHLLACFGKLVKGCQPFIPVQISHLYAGYGWYAAVPTITAVELDRSERVIHRDWLASGELLCVERLRITVRTSDGQVLAADMPVAVDPTVWDDGDHRVLVTTAGRMIHSDSLWYLLGGWSEDGDTYETQESRFCDALDEFWIQVDGPDEVCRRAIVGMIQKHLGDKWQFVSVTAAGKVMIQVDERRTRELKPRKGGPTWA